MPTKQPRFSVIKDPELTRALAIARQDAELAELSEAARMRALALRGAEALLHADELDSTHRALIQAGAELATEDLLAASHRIRKRVRQPADGAKTATETLEWVRRD